MAISPIPHWFEGSEYTHKVAACIMKYGPISRITLAQILGLSQGAVSRITSDLIYAGVIEETPMAAGHGGKLPKDFLRKSAQKSIQKENTERRGRPQTGLRIIANARTFVGMKINTTHITAVTVNALGQIVTGCHDLPLDDDSPESVVDVIKQLTMDCADEAIMAGVPSPCPGGGPCGGRPPPITHSQACRKKPHASLDVFYSCNLPSTLSIFVSIVVFLFANIHGGIVNITLLSSQATQ